MIDGQVMAAAMEVMVEAEAVAAVVVAEVEVEAVTMIAPTTRAKHGVVWREYREETLAIQTGEGAVLKMNALRATWSEFHLRTERCHAAKDSLGLTREAMRHRRKAAEYVRRLRFRTARRVLLTGLPEFNWMKIFVDREFFGDEIRDRLSHDVQRKLPPIQTRRLRLHLKRDRRESFRVRKHEKSVQGDG
jgi:hypothetical protein